jgi:hypothetical protein
MHAAFTPNFAMETGAQPVIAQEKSSPDQPADNDVAPPS